MHSIIKDQSDSNIRHTFQASWKSSHSVWIFRVKKARRKLQVIKQYKMPSQTFYLLGQDVSTAKTIEVNHSKSLEDLKLLIAAHFAITDPNGEWPFVLHPYSHSEREWVLIIGILTIIPGIGFLGKDAVLTETSEVTTASGPVPITIDGHAVRDPPSPRKLPFVGNFFEVYPDHLGNHQRLFDQYGPVIKTDNMGRITYQTNDPAIAAIALAESDFFTKKINEAHPLYALKNASAGVFLGDTDTEEWRVAHKFLPPALGPKAVRHYAPTMQKTVEDAFKVLDHLDEQGEAWNVYYYMLKLGSQAVGKLTLGLDFQHFTSPSAPVHEMVHSIAEMLSLNKKVTSKGDWYNKLPFGDPKRLRDLKARIEEMVGESIEVASRGGVEDLPLQDAAVKADNMVGK